MRGKPKKNKVVIPKEQPCWHCIHAVPNKTDRGCSWSERGEPVEGWKANFIEGRYDKHSKRSECDRYQIISCPKFVYDGRE